MENVVLAGSVIREEDKSLIPKLHNGLRSCIATGKQLENCKGLEYDQPIGRNIQELVWDDALAANAQRWAEHCTFAHDSKQHRFDPRFCVGQNVHITKLAHEEDDSAIPDFTNAITRWFNEQNDYIYKKHTNVSRNSQKKKTGHYTQLIWATSNLVGCGYAYFKDNDKYYTSKKLYVCNYGPCGNKIASFPYDYGEPACDAYNMTWSGYTGLCINTETSKDQPLDIQEVDTGS